MAGKRSTAKPQPQIQIFSPIWLGGRFNYPQLFLFGPEMAKKIDLEHEEKNLTKTKNYCYSNETNKINYFKRCRVRDLLGSGVVT